MPHSVPGDDGHYLPFSQVYGTCKSEEHRPSFKHRLFVPTKRVKRKLPFHHASVQHIKNTDNYNGYLWRRLVFSKYKLKKKQRDELQKLLDDHMYSCGASLRGLDLPADYTFVIMTTLILSKLRLYYSAKYEPFCVYCAQDQPYTSIKVILFAPHVRMLW